MVNIEKIGEKINKSSTVVNVSKKQHPMSSLPLSSITKTVCFVKINNHHGQLIILFQ
jgi:hypothetical protein